MLVMIADLQDPEDSDGRTYREVNNAKTHSFNVGQMVEIHNGCRMFIAKHGRDCDGTPLYSLTTYEDTESARLNPISWSHGHDEEGMTEVR